jgi:hypothetical protein
MKRPVISLKAQVCDCPKADFSSPLLKRRYRVNLVEHLQHDDVGCRLDVERFVVASAVPLTEHATATTMSSIRVVMTHSLANEDVDVKSAASA